MMIGNRKEEGRVCSAALDGFWSPVEMNGTGTGRNGTVPGKMHYRNAANGSRFLPLLLTGCQREIYRFLPFYITGFGTFFAS